MLTALPHNFLARVAKEDIGLTLPPAGQYGAGIVFLPQDTAHYHVSHQHSAKSSQVAMPHGAHVAAGELPGDALALAGTQDSQFGTNCSVCASCCIGAVLLPAGVLPGSPDFSTMPLPLASTALISFITDGQLRPPRPFLA